VQLLLRHPVNKITGKVFMSTARAFASSKFFIPSESEPLRTVVKETDNAVIVAWLVLPGQQIRPHVHPQGQDTWTILSGSGEYVTDLDGTVQKISAGDVVVACTNDVHGVINNGSEPLQFISVVAPANAGYELINF
jgi:quercetin dioxygenase-like cupin family protein